MQFTQNVQVPQLYVATDNSNARPGTFLYLLPQKLAGLPASFTFAESWNNAAGVYIFLEQPLAIGTELAFAASAWAFLADPRTQGARFAWFNLPNNSGLLTGTWIAAYTPTGSSQSLTAFPVRFTFQNLALYVAANTPVTPDLTNFAFTFQPQNAQALYLTANWGSTSINTVGSTLTLPGTGNLSGCLQFSLKLTPQNLTDLDIGFRYFYAVPPDAQHPDTTASDGSFFLASLRYPLFSAGLTLYANLDPLAPLIHARTFFAFTGADAGQPSSGEAPVVAAYFNLTLGDAFTLQPLTGSAAPTAFASLVFATNQQASTPTPHDPFYLVPRGDFALQTARSGEINIMCGLSGVEYMALDNVDTVTNRISFFPGQSAFAQGFAPEQKPGYTNLKPAALPSTSFVSVTARAPAQGAAPIAVDYFAQPDQSVLYNYSSRAVKGVTTISALAAVPVLAATLDNPPTSSLLYPLLPYSGLNGQNLAVYRQMESQIISPTRRGALTNSPPRARLTAMSTDPPASKYSTTPQGLLATYVAGAATWSEIILAQMILPLASPAQFTLTNVQDNLLTAFQSNKLFLVVSDPSSITNYLKPENAQITIGSDPAETWQFDVDPATWDTLGTIFIIKFYNMSLSDLAGQTSTWAFGDTFNQNPTITSGRISDTIHDAIKANDPDLATFINAVTDPNWNGILMLKVKAPLEELPSELAGLSAGIDASQFFAHHVGINASKINVPSTPGDLSISNSSIFGMINYKAPQSMQANGADYQFQVEQLKVLFLNSAVAAFSSIIDLQINTLFSEAVTLEGTSGTSGNIVRMYGVYQKHVVNGQTLESYLFQTQAGTNSIFAMTSNVLNAVLLSKGQFISVYPRPLIIAAANGAVRTGGITTITTTTLHGLTVGDTVDINGVTDSSFNGQFTIATVPSTTTFTYAQTVSADKSSGDGTARATATVSQFVFWGLLDFKLLPNFDLFSFGRPSWQIATSANNGAVRKSGTTTITTIVPHGLGIGDKVDINGVSDSSFDGRFPIATAPSITSFTYAQIGASDTTSGNGMASVPVAGGLNFSKMVIDMTYDSALTQPAQFTFDVSQLAFDLAASVTRPASFFCHFPLTIAGFTQAKQGTTPDGLGYMGVQTPLTQSSLKYPWYSLNFNLNLGSPGALAAQEGFVASLTAAWSPGAGQNYTVFTGLKLPGSNGTKRAIVIEGLFNITFKTLEIIALPATNTFILVLYNIGFKFLSITFPPTGQVNFVLFGDPNATSSNANLGWYAAYAKPQSKPAGGSGQPGLPAGSHVALPSGKEDAK